MDAPELTRDHFEILVVRELRKAGLDVADVRTHRRTELPEPDRGYLVELNASLSGGAWRRRALIACRRQALPLERASVESVKEHVAEARAQVGLLFAAAPVTPDVLLAADEAGVALLHVADGRTAFDASGWGAGGGGGPAAHYPAWLPAYVAQVVERDPAGQVRYRILAPEDSEVLVRRLQP